MARFDEAEEIYIQNKADLCQARLILVKYEFILKI